MLPGETALELGAEVLARVPRPGEDALFLPNEEASYITGQLLFVDGGRQVEVGQARVDVWKPKAPPREGTGE